MWQCKENLVIAAHEGTLNEEISDGAIIVFEEDHLKQNIG